MLPDIPDSCDLRSPAFAALLNPVFRRSVSDDAPVLIISLGERDAALTLPSVQRLLGVADDSDDGRMLALIAQALDFVAALRPGEKLPAELRNGEASWATEPAHLRRAAGRLRLGLLAWLRDDEPAGAMAMDDAALECFEADPALRQQIQTAFANAAHTLGLADAAAVIPLVAELAHELAFIEALRERFLLPLAAAARTIDAASHGWRGDEYHQDMLVQARRLLATALTAMTGRFAQIATQCASVIGMLRGVAVHRDQIRANRDWLYRSQRAFAPILEQWDTAPPRMDGQFWPRIASTTRFLAPRFMVSQEWTHTRSR